MYQALSWMEGLQVTESLPPRSSQAVSNKEMDSCPSAWSVLVQKPRKPWDGSQGKLLPLGGHGSLRLGLAG